MVFLWFSIKTPLNHHFSIAFWTLSLQHCDLSPDTAETRESAARQLRSRADASGDNGGSWFLYQIHRYIDNHRSQSLPLQLTRHNFNHPPQHFVTGTLASTSTTTSLLMASWTNLRGKLTLLLTLCIFQTVVPIEMAIFYRHSTAL